jgi:starvation-inducible DNA-binding protein
MEHALNIGLAAPARKTIADQLNLLLANEYILYTKTLNYHWNVEGKHFGALHVLFNKQYEQLLETVDAVAERARALGFFAAATLVEFLKVGTIKENPAVYPDDLGMIADLVTAHEEVIRQMRNINDMTIQLNDAGTNNFISALIEMHEKMAWMLRAHLNNK